MKTQCPTRSISNALTVSLCVLLAASATAGAGTERHPKQERPTWWDNPDFKNTNPGMDDADRDGKPDGWNTSGNASNAPPGSGETTITQSGSVWQKIPNIKNPDNCKEYALEITYRTEGLEDSDTATVGISPEGGSTHTYTLAHTDGEEVTGTIYFRMSPQPASETVTIRLAANSVDDKLIITGFDFRTKCFLKEDSIFKCASYSLGTGDGQDTTVWYDPYAQTLGFSDSVIRVLNADGSRQDDPAYRDDPLHGAVVSVSAMTLHAVTPDGIWFRDGRVAIHDYNAVYFEAAVPWLWIDNEAREVYGADVFADLDDTAFDLDLGSRWLSDFVAAYEHSYAWPALFVRTTGNLEEAVRFAREPVQLEAGVSFGSGGDCGPGCTGRESIRQARCSEKRGKRKLTVKLQGGLPHDAFRVELTSGESSEGTLNGKGKGKAAFSDVPPGPGIVTARFGCGAVKESEYFCP
ncbi:MAG: hypothetical protein C4547_08635 [Phycisphaerales bacterium]|nr:MAG: hypothetical protein C4547_08635 [Phycisphaerales bacterium]